MSALGLLLSITIGISLGFFGGGGSILTVPLLVYVFGLEPKVAIASSLLIVGIASAAGAIQHARVGNLRPREGLLFGVAGMCGAYLGGRASAFLDPALLLLLFASMMLLTASAMWRGRSTTQQSVAGGAAPVKLALQGLAVGSFTGLVGAGGGFLIVPALALWAGLPMPAAVGTSLLIIVMNSAAGFAGYLSHVQVDYTLIAAVTTAAVGGSFLGSWLARRIEPASLRRSFAGFVLAMACFILVRESAAVVEAASGALPTSGPQLVFALVMLAIGVLTGRSSRAAEQEREELVYAEGGGI